MVNSPTLDVERALLTSGVRRLAACDEVGRGALAGPVTVGIVVVELDGLVDQVEGVRDSKLLTARGRSRLVPSIETWADDHAVAHASASEIDRLGIIAALRLAGWRALEQLRLLPDLVLLDGSHDWLTPPPHGELFGGDAETQATAEVAAQSELRVVTRVRADLECASVAAASVLAKHDRDRIMIDLAARHPAYGWERNKGYGSAAHRDAITRHGPTGEHRQSWRLVP